MEYAKKTDLILPEYGRNIQQMVHHAMTIENREERNRCARTIVNIMGNLFPYLRDVNDFKHKLWDHLAIMSDFKLDIDYPYEVFKKENLYTKPERIPYKVSRIKYMHYGRTLEQMIDKAAVLPDGGEKQQLTQLIANQMKKCFLIWNKDNVSNEKILKDLAELSDGRLNLTEESIHLSETKDILHPGKQRNGHQNSNNRKQNNHKRK
ncbi:MAG: DUF4290 domain-containing protein [Prevotellaceae bacterium]|jgi:hypothetical protein|nr:DUF4290 domain-containing protein [Prevotellaceae bacterium]